MWALGVQRAWTHALSGNGGWCWGWKVTTAILGGLRPGKGHRELHLVLLFQPISHRSEPEPVVWVTWREHGCAGTSAVSWSQLPVGTRRGAGPPRTPQHWLRAAAPGRGGQLMPAAGMSWLPRDPGLLLQEWNGAAFPPGRRLGSRGVEQGGWPCCGAGVTSLGLEGAGHGPPCPSVSPQRWGPAWFPPHTVGAWGWSWQQSRCPLC